MILDLASKNISGQLANFLVYVKYNQPHLICKECPQELRNVSRQTKNPEGKFNFADILNPCQAQAKRDELG